MKVLFTLLLTVFSFQAWAGDAGCGLGSMIISKNSKGLQLLALTTNGSFLSQAFGITSGTSGCSSSGIVKNELEMDYFVEVNHDELSREMAQGKGEKLDTLALLSGCESIESQMTFNSWAQKSYSKIVPTAQVTGEQMASNFKKELNDSNEVAQACIGETTSL